LNNHSTIVIVNDFGHVNGGTAQVAIADAIALAQAGYRVFFFCAVGPVSPALIAAGVEVVCLDQQEIAADPDRLRAAKQGLWNGKAAQAMDKLLADIPFAIVHIHGWSKALSGSVAAAAIARRAPVVVTLHDFFAACPNGGFYQFPQQRICGLRAMSASCIACNCDPRSYPQKLYRVVRQAVQRYAGHLPDGISHFILHSALVRDVMASYLPSSASLHFIPMAIDVEPAKPVSVAKNLDFVMVGRLSPEKGAVLFAKAAAQVGVRPVFIGEGRMQSDIKARAPDAEIVGWLPRQALFARLTTARALVFPSLCYETFGLTVAEALARGIPVIVSDQTAAAELITDGQTGLLFRTGDAAHLSTQIKRLQDDVFAETLGRAAHARYWSNPMTEKRHISELLKVFSAAAGA
jgi:glycosyltransferase involved in cell wall biosynthesis